MGVVEQVHSSRANIVFPVLAPPEVGRNHSAFDAIPGKTSILPVGQLRASVLSYSNMHHYGELFISYLKARHDVFIN